MSDHTAPTTDERPTCRIHRALGRVEECPGAECPLWDEAGGSCVVDELRLDVERAPELAGYLLRLREDVERARTRPDTGGTAA